MPQSQMLRTMYLDWQAQATPEQLILVDAIYAECEDHYDNGGDTIVECFSPSEILAEFKSVQDAKAYCGLKVEQELNTRWGEDDDPQVKRAARFKEW